MSVEEEVLWFYFERDRYFGRLIATGRIDDAQLAAQQIDISTFRPTRWHWKKNLADTIIKRRLGEALLSSNPWLRRRAERIGGKK